MRIWFLLVAVLTILLPISAQARPRDEAMSGAFRCAVIAPSRVWLDCYYGAAQPVRAALNLPPAPAAQLTIAAAPPATGAAPPDPARDEVMTAAAGCISLTGDRAWLDCYYGASGAVRAELGLPPLTVSAQARPQPVPYQPVVVAPHPAGPPPMPRSAGLLGGLFNNPKPVVRNMKVRSYSMGRAGTFVITLADGEVWQQGENDAIYNPVRWQGDGSNLVVTITPSAMRTFNLQVEGEEKFYKVRRVR